MYKAIETQEVGAWLPGEAYWKQQTDSELPATETGERCVVITEIEKS